MDMNECFNTERLCHPNFQTDGLHAGRGSGTTMVSTQKYWMLEANIWKLFKINSKGQKSFISDHWYPCFGLLVTFPLVFKARVDLLLAYFITCVWWIPQIYRWCNTCWTYGGQHGKQSPYPYTFCGRQVHPKSCKTSKIIEFGLVLFRLTFTTILICKLSYYGVPFWSIHTCDLLGVNYSLND